VALAATNKLSSRLAAASGLPLYGPILAGSWCHGAIPMPHLRSWKMNISVVDNGANEIFFERMDGAYLGSGDIARHKAQTSARFPFPTRGIEQLA
jgi:glc operon protein GlcG